jgi:hypothetical protein
MSALLSQHSTSQVITCARVGVKYERLGEQYAEHMTIQCQAEYEVQHMHTVKN